MKLGRTRPSLSRILRAVGVEDAHDPRLDPVVAVIGHRDRLGEPLGLVVAAARADRVDVAPVVFALGVDLGIAVDLGRAGQQEPRVLGLGQPERIVGAERADLERRDRDESDNRPGWPGWRNAARCRPARRSRSARRRCARRSGTTDCSTRCAMLRRLPVNRLSTQMTSSPSPRNRSQRCEPMNPAPPVMTVLKDESS